jgi:hypothetical protein
MQDNFLDVKYAKYVYSGIYKILGTLQTLTFNLNAYDRRSAYDYSLDFGVTSLKYIVLFF